MPDLQPASVDDVPEVVAPFSRYDAFEFGLVEMDALDVAGPLTA